MKEHIEDGLVSLTHMLVFPLRQLNKFFSYSFCPPFFVIDQEHTCIKTNPNSKTRWCSSQVVFA